MVPTRRSTAHMARASMEVIKEMFPNAVTCHGLLDRFPVCDYFLWGYLKRKVFINKLRTLDELKAAIRQEIAAIPQDMVQCAMQTFQARLKECARKNGEHLDDIILKTK